MPPIFSIGYHFSKWDKEMTAQSLIKLHEDFEKSKFPLDALWMDIAYTDKSRYFVFDQNSFPKHSFDKLKEDIRQK